MVPVSGIRASTAEPAARRPRDEAASSLKAGSGRALIALQPIVPAGSPARTGPQACFLAHLIATDQQLPQTRERRRAELQDAIAAYAAANAKAPSRTGRTLFRTT
jgi:hypothetical protein